MICGCFVFVSSFFFLFFLGFFNVFVSGISQFSLFENFCLGFSSQKWVAKVSRVEFPINANRMETRGSLEKLSGKSTYFNPLSYTYSRTRGAQAIDSCRVRLWRHTKWHIDIQGCEVGLADFCAYSRFDHIQGWTINCKPAGRNRVLPACWVLSYYSVW